MPSHSSYTVGFVCFVCFFFAKNRKAKVPRFDIHATQIIGPDIPLHSQNQILKKILKIFKCFTLLIDRKAYLPITWKAILTRHSFMFSWDYLDFLHCFENQSAIRPRNQRIGTIYQKYFDNFRSDEILVKINASTL